MKPLALIAVAGLCLLLGFTAGALVSADRSWFQPLATVTIRNESGQPLRSLDIRYENSVLAGTMLLPPLSSGASVDARVYMPGEGVLQVNAVLSDGTLVRGSEAYVESGYRTTQVVRGGKLEGAARYRP